MEAFNIEDQVRLLRRVPLRAGCAILSELLMPAGRLARAGAELTLSMVCRRRSSLAPRSCRPSTAIIWPSTRR